jgi:hypothetical protein
VIAYKFTAAGGTTYNGFAWPLPTADGPGEWVEVTGTQGLQLLVRKVQHGFIQEEHSAHE